MIIKHREEGILIFLNLNNVESFEEFGGRYIKFKFKNREQIFTFPTAEKRNSVLELIVDFYTWQRLFCDLTV